MAGRLEGKVAIILGASQRGGAGWTIAEVLAAEGAQVFVAARRIEKVEELASEIGGPASRCDAAKEEEVAAFVEATVAKAGKIDICVAAVGARQLTRMLCFSPSSPSVCIRPTSASFAAP